jgi:hypothetical protein
VKDSPDRQTKALKTIVHGPVLVNGQVAYRPGYLEYHSRRIARTVQKLREIGARKIVEVGAHPWVMTAHLIDNPAFEVCATVSAEELTRWPDDIGVSVQDYQIRTARGDEVTVRNYSANVERTRFKLHEVPDTALACEIVEHLIRSPHVMFLNINGWLPVSGKLFVTTPNGAQFANPFRRRSPTAAYRANVYERHSYVYTLDELVELITLCGFSVMEAGYWDVIERRGPSSVYGVLSQVPWRYLQDKFKKTIYVVGRKERDVAELERVPRVCDPRGNWEFIAQSKRDGAG